MYCPPISQLIMKDKNQQTESRTSLAISNQNETTNNQSTDFVDNSQEAQEAKRLQEMADNSQESLALQQWQNNVQPPPEENTTGLPDDLKNNLESMFGMSLDQVKVHYNSPKPAKLEAHAYAEFPNIYIAPGQEKYLPEEAVHMIQQMQGRVKASKKVNGTAINDNPSLEKEAIKEGQKASGGVQKKGGKNLVQKKGQGVVQRAKIEKKSHYGTFSVDDAKYKFVNSNKELDANITFEPGDNTDATKIGLTQIIKNQQNGKNQAIDPNAATRMTGDGHRIDRLSNMNTPIYGSDALATGKGLKDTKQDNNDTTDPTNLEPGVKRNATYELGHHYKVKKEDENFKTKNAGLYDGPTIEGGANSMKEFETTALALDGKQKGEYYGSVKWGWEKDGTGTLKKIDFDLVSKGVPSKNFMEATEKWNDGKARGTAVVKNDNTDVEAVTSSAVLFKLQKGDEVIQKGTLGTSTESFIKIKVQKSSKDPLLVGKIGTINIKYLNDKGDGNATVDIPLVKTQIPTEADISYYNDGAKNKKGGTLPLKTRMKVSKPKETNEDKGTIKMKIVDGDLTGKEVWVLQSKLKDE